MIDVPGPGGYVCTPPFSSWRGVAEKQRREPTGAGGLREDWRAEFLRLAAAHTAPLGLPVPALDATTPVVLSGHQPYFYHPGVMYKYLLLARVAREGFLAVNIGVDTEACEGFHAKIPSFDGKYRKHTRHLATSSVKRFYADAVLDKAEVRSFVEESLRDLGSIPGGAFEHGKDFLRRELFSDLPQSAADAMTVLRRRYAVRWPGKVLEVPLSQACRTKGFFSFAFGLLKDAGRFAEIFNAAVRRYRVEHKLRSSANPFPDLAAGVEGVETLFWLVREGRRDTLTIKPGVNPGVAGFSEVGGPESLESLFCEKGWRLWPKAVALSVMNRVFLGDIFVHGLGGAKYDRITDEVIRGFYGVEPPPFATASLTLSVEGLEDPSDRIMELRQELREMDFHPESYLADPPPDLLAEKQNLTREIKAPGANKKEMGRRLGEINGALKSLLEPLKGELLAKTAALETELNRYEVLADRELPYFLYPPEKFDQF
ncbi:MAG: hypothetical protein HY098_00630 [Nitrospinae bacterium]|nr:hypothetical protein [Nitrospinota bacterium]